MFLLSINKRILMSSNHINAQKKDISDKIIIAGDPVRVKNIAYNYLQDVIKINTIRYMLGYTGYYKNVRISILSHGMGIPSVSIYLTELIEFYNVKKIIRIGTCGSALHNIQLNDIIIAMGACTDSNINRIRFNNYDFSAVANFKLVLDAYNISKKLNIPVHIGNVFTTDLFYQKDKKIINIIKEHRILGIEMETAGIYFLSSLYNIDSLSVCTVSDHIESGEKLSYKERESILNKSTQIVLETICK